MPTTADTMLVAVPLAKVAEYDFILFLNSSSVSVSFPLENAVVLTTAAPVKGKVAKVVTVPIPALPEEPASVAITSIDSITSSPAGITASLSVANFISGL